MQVNEQEFEFMTIPEVAARFGRGRTWVYAIIKRDPTFPRPVSFGGSTRRLLRREVEAYRAKHLAHREPA
jgi:predicted DNA-binding transcriptional regulator AlpA